MNDSENGNKIIKMLDTVGFMGPFILFGIGVWQLWGNNWCMAIMGKSWILVCVFSCICIEFFH